MDIREMMVKGMVSELVRRSALPPAALALESLRRNVTEFIESIDATPSQESIYAQRPEVRAAVDANIPANIARFEFVADAVHEKLRRAGFDADSPGAKEVGDAGLEFEEELATLKSIHIKIKEGTPTNAEA